MRVILEAQPLLRPLTGVGQYTRHLIEQMIPLAAARGVELTLFYFNFLGRNRVMPQWDGDLTTRQHRWIPGRCFYFLWKKRIGPAFDRLAGKGEVFHFPNFIARPLKSGKAVATIHDVAFMRFPQLIEKKNLRFLQTFLPGTLKRASRILAVSEFTKRELVALAGVPENKIVVTPNGVSEEFRRIEDERALKQVREKYQLPERFILSVGTLEPRKNLSTVIEALGRMKREGKDAPPLVLVGPPGWNDEYTRLRRAVLHAELEDQVKFLHYADREDMPALYSAARFLVFPSLYEGFGLPVAEAMACGLPVLSSDAASLPEVGGKAPLYLSPEDAGAWAEGIRALWDSPSLLEQMRRRGFEQAGKFSWRATAEKTLEAYEQAHWD